MESSAPEFTAGQRHGDGRFVLERFLGKGGMGVVWLATDEELVETVALKFLPADWKDFTQGIEALKRETKKSHKLPPPHIVRVHDLNVSPGKLPFISMEYVEGGNLRELQEQSPNQQLT